MRIIAQGSDIAVASKWGLFGSKCGKNGSGRKGRYEYGMEEVEIRVVDGRIYRFRVRKGILRLVRHEVLRDGDGNRV